MKILQSLQSSTVTMAQASMTYKSQPCSGTFASNMCKPLSELGDMHAQHATQESGPSATVEMDAVLYHTHRLLLAVLLLADAASRWLTLPAAERLSAAISVQRLLAGQ